MKLQTCSACQDLPTLQFWSKFDYPSWSYCPFYIIFFLTLILFVLYFKNYLQIDVKFKLQKIYLPCNFEVNPITHFDRLCKLDKRGDEICSINFFFDEIVIGWFSSKNVSGGSALRSRWPPQPNLA